MTAFEDREHIEWEREENNRVKAFTVGALNDLGYDVPESHTNHLFVDLRAPARGFREACMESESRCGQGFSTLGKHALPYFSGQHGRDGSCGQGLP